MSKKLQGGAIMDMGPYAASIHRIFFNQNITYLKISFKKNKNYQINTIEVLHEVGTSVFTKNEHEKEKLKELCSWHFIWSKFYFYKKHYGFLVSIIYFVPIIIRILFKIILFTLKREEKKIKKYKTRWSGLISSIKNQTSYKRID